MFMNRKRLLLTLFRLEENQQKIMERLEELGHLSAPCGGTSSQGEADWINQGIESILGYKYERKVSER